VSEQERTFVAVKPDGVQRGLVGEVIARFERRGLKLAGMKMLKMPTAMAETHYGEHKGKPFFDGLVRHITSAPVVAMVLEGKDAVALARSVIGATNPAQSAPGTIRGDLAVDLGRNVVHGSDSPDSARREIALFFTDAEMLSWDRSLEPWIREPVTKK
jgi:nucleoside-diphosphate kinase